MLDDISEADFHWLVGMIEGEGCFSVHQNALHFVIGSVDLDVMQRLAKLLDKKTKLTEQNLPSGKILYTFGFGKARSTALADKIYPFLSQRRQNRIREIQALEPKPHVDSFAVVVGNFLANYENNH